MRAYMNNLHGRRHEAIYGQGAYFDLDVVGAQAKMLLGIEPGTECVVASYADRRKRTILFATYTLQREALLPNESPTQTCRVFFGALVKTERLSKLDATREPRYAPFFNKAGHFKRPSGFYGPN
jgi:hypothetical protein